MNTKTLHKNTCKQTDRTTSHILTFRVKDITLHTSSSNKYFNSIQFHFIWMCYQQTLGISYLRIEIKMKMKNVDTSRSSTMKTVHPQLRFICWWNTPNWKVNPQQKPIKVTTKSYKRWKKFPAYCFTVMYTFIAFEISICVSADATICLERWRSLKKLKQHT